MRSIIRLRSIRSLISFWGEGWKRHFCCVSVLMKIQETQTVILTLSKLISSHFKNPAAHAVGEACHIYQQCQKPIPPFPLPTHWRVQTFCFLSAYLPYRTLSTVCQKHCRLLAYYRNTEVLLPCPSVLATAAMKIDKENNYYLPAKQK